jgi:hypothetical protein
MKLNDYIVVIVLFLGCYYLIKRSQWGLSDMNRLMICFAVPLVYLLIVQNKGSVKYEGFEADPSVVDEDEMVEDSNVKPYPGKPEHTDADVADAREIAAIDKKELREINEREAEERKKIRKEYQYEMPYTIAHEYNTRPLGRQVPGYTYLPPENWFRPWDRVPICVGGGKFDARPTTASASLDQQYLEFDTHVEVEKPMEINTHYLDEIQNHRAGNKRPVSGWK